jgi:hypothetical protein
MTLADVGLALKVRCAVAAGLGGAHLIDQDGDGDAAGSNTMQWYKP